MKNSGNRTAMTPDAAARVQSATAKANGGAVSKDSFAARAQSTAAVPKVPLINTLPPEVVKRAIEKATIRS